MEVNQSLNVASTEASLDSSREITLSWMAVEVSVWAVLYAILIANMLVPYVRKTLSAQPFWEPMLQRQGQVLTSMAEESVMAMSISVHHLFGGSLMLYGQLVGNEEIWLHGLFVEIGFEVVDVIALILNQYPYTVVQPGLRMLTLFHHFPGLFAAPNLIMKGLHRNSDLQAIGWSLLLAGGVSLLCDSFKQTRSLDTQLGQWLTLHIINMIGVILARFVIFPVASYNLLTKLWAGESAWMGNLAAAGIASMAVFNAVVIVIMSEKLYRNGGMYLFGKKKLAKTE